MASIARLISYKFILSNDYKRQNFQSSRLGSFEPFHLNPQLQTKATLVVVATI